MFKYLILFILISCANNKRTVAYENFYYWLYQTRNSLVDYQRKETAITTKYLINNSHKLFTSYCLLSVTNKLHAEQLIIKEFDIKKFSDYKDVYSIERFRERCHKI